MLYKKIYDCFLGKYLIVNNKDSVLEFDKVDDDFNTLEVFLENDFTNKIVKELDEYFEGKRQKFTLKLDMRGSDFQKSVWHELCKIPYNEQISYKELASRVGNPKASRAVGNANGKNPISIIVPCHRVINANGDLGGYGGGIDTKKKLLELESKNSDETFDLLSLPNIGAVTVSELKAVGINTIKEFKKIGPEKSFLMIRSNNPSSCKAMFNSIFAASLDKPKRSLTIDEKQLCNEIYKDLNV